MKNVFIKIILLFISLNISCSNEENRNQSVKNQQKNTRNVSSNIKTNSLIKNNTEPTATDEINTLSKTTSENIEDKEHNPKESEEEKITKNEPIEKSDQVSQEHVKNDFDKKSEENGDDYLEEKLDQVQENTENKEDSTIKSVENKVDDLQIYSKQELIIEQNIKKAQKVVENEIKKIVDSSYYDYTAYSSISTIGKLGYTLATFAQSLLGNIDFRFTIKNPTDSFPTVCLVMHNSYNNYVLVFHNTPNKYNTINTVSEVDLLQGNIKTISGNIFYQDEENNKIPLVLDGFLLKEITYEDTYYFFNGYHHSLVERVYPQIRNAWKKNDQQEYPLHHRLGRKKDFIYMSDLKYGEHPNGTKTVHLNLTKEGDQYIYNPHSNRKYATQVFYSYRPTKTPAFQVNFSYTGGYKNVKEDLHIHEDKISEYTNQSW